MVVMGSHGAAPNHCGLHLQRGEITNQWVCISSCDLFPVGQVFWCLLVMIRRAERYFIVEPLR